MRITNNMIVNSYLTSFNSAMERQNKLQEQLSDGKQIHRASDDPVRAVRSLKYNTNLAENEQFTQNVKDAVSWMETTDSAISELNSIMIRARELVVNADGSKPAEALQALGKELDGLIDAAVTIGNTQIGDRYLFADQMDKTLPLTRQTIKNAAGESVEVVVYNGDNNKISMPVKTGLVDPSQDSVNLTGVEAFGPSETMTDATTGNTVTTLKTLNDLIKVKNELLKTSSITQSNANGGAATVGGTYTGTETNVVVRIDAVDGATGKVTDAYFSTNGGTDWTQAVADTSTDPTTFTLAGLGVTTQIATKVANATNNTYSFRIPYSSAAPDTTWLGSTGLATVADGHDYIIQAQTGIGARSTAYEMISNMLLANNTTITDNLSANEDLDIPKAIIDFKNSENVYNAALAIGSKIMPQSLVDFLR